MKIRKFISATMLALIAALSAPAFASSISLSSDVLHINPSLNKKLEPEEYDFSNLHLRYGASFTDSWKFTVADNSTASISVYDLEVNFWNLGFAQPNSPQPLQHFSRHSINTSKIFDTKYMVFSVFDYKGDLIGSAGENGTLSNLNLLAGKWYTIQVSGKVNGYFGSAYHGALEINPMPVPLGDTAPMLGSALALLALRLRGELRLRKRSPLVD